MTAVERRQAKLAIGHKRYNRHILLSSFVIYIKVTRKTQIPFKIFKKYLDVLGLHQLIMNPKGPKT